MTAEGRNRIYPRFGAPATAIGGKGSVTKAQEILSALQNEFSD